MVRGAGAAAAGDQQQVLVLRGVRREERREGGRDDEHRDEQRAEDRRGVPHEPAERVAPEPARRRLERDLVGLELGNAHTGAPTKCSVFRGVVMSTESSG